MKIGHLQNTQSFETSIETGNLQRYNKQSIVFSQIFMLNMTKIYLDMSHFLNFFLALPLKVKPVLTQNQDNWNLGISFCGTFSDSPLHERKCTLFALIVTQNQNISNVNSSLTWKNRKLISYFRSPW